MNMMSEDMVHKALSSEIRRHILLSLAEKDKYLTELSNELDRTPQTIDFHLNILADTGLVESKQKEGKRYYSLIDRKILSFLREHRPIPVAMRPKPPHEIMMDAWQDITERLDRLEGKVDELLNKLTFGRKR